MTGSARERSPGVWEIRAFLGRDPITNKPRQVSRIIRTNSRRQVDKAQAALVTEAAARQSVPTAGTFAVLLDRWLAEIERRFSIRYAASARAAVEKRIRPQLGHIKLPALTGEHLDRFYGAMAAEGLSNGTVHLYATYIQSALSLAVRWQWLDRSPFERSSPPAAPKRGVAPPSTAQVLVLLKAAAERNLDLGALLVVAATTGMRRGEICGLRWSDIDVDGAALVVNRTVVQVRGRWETKRPKADEPRRVSLAPFTLAVLAAQRERSEGHWPLGPDAYVWSYKWGNVQPFLPSSVTTFFMHLRDDCGLPNVRLHDLRHYSVTTLLTSGVDVKTVAGRHGHQNTTMTLDTYGHFMQSADVEAAKIMGELLRPADT